MNTGANTEVIGHGVYPLRRAAALIGTTPAKLRRWTRGTSKSDPLFTARYRGLDTTELSFIDLVEARVVNALRAEGISLQAIRTAIEIAKDLFGEDRPFASSRFRTDGAEVFLELERDGSLHRLSRRMPGQGVFPSVVGPTLKDIDYGDGRAQRWTPAGHPTVVIDPARAFGRSIIATTGVPTETLAASAARHGIELTALDFEVDEADVAAAVAFEEPLAA